jgi:2',3'-cyclic-nucleotide 2'-phosphodiesterase/3'-nucleotidase
MRLRFFALLAAVLAALAAGCRHEENPARPDAAAVTLRIVETTDVHGALFPYDFIEDRKTSNSLAQVHTYVREQRADEAYDRVILLDNGDILQGQPIVTYFNFEADLDTTDHIVAEVMNYMDYDAATVGNHDIEPGPAVYDRFARQLDCPWLSANTIDTATGKPYFPPYAIIDVPSADGSHAVRVAILGLTTPGVPNWLPRSAWEGLEFVDLVPTAERWMATLEATENPDIVIGLFHAGYDDAYGDFGDQQGQDKGPSENASRFVAARVPGFDLICIGHDHRNTLKTVGGTKVMGCAAGARKVAAATIELAWNAETGEWDRAVAAEIVDVTGYRPDPAMMTAFRGAIETTRAHVGERIGHFTKATSSRDAMFADASFTDLILELQMDVSQTILGRRADIAFAAPLQFDKTIDAGPVHVRDMYKLYRFENALHLMNLTGSEVDAYLEYSCAAWFNQMNGPDDHLLNFVVYDEATGYYDLAARYYNFDSAAGIVYEVDVSRPAGDRVAILGMDADLDGEVDEGSAFDPAALYACAINSYRASGGGGHLAAAGLTREEIDAETRIIARTKRDLRSYLIDRIRARGETTPRAIGQWRVVPVAWAAAGETRDRAILYGGRPR